MALQILLVVEEERRSAETVRAVTAAGCDIAAVISCNDDICTAVHRLRPDAVLISTASPDREWLARLRDISPEAACPVVLCCDDDSAAAVEVATQAGLAERKVLERAKGLVMKQHGVSESEAYHALRRLAMGRGGRRGGGAE